MEFLPITLLGADVHTGKLQYVINGPEMHRWHHAIDLTEGGINFATKLAVWDWLFGTSYLPSTKPKGYGLLNVNFPRNYFVRHMFAFRPFHHTPPPQEEKSTVRVAS